MKTRTILSLVLLLGCFSIGWAADHVKGNGKLTTRKITVEDYNEIKLDDVIEFQYEQSDGPANIEITIDKNLHQYVDINTKDRVLRIGFKGAKVDHYTKFVVKSNSKWLSKALIAGNANFVVNSPISGDETLVKASGSSTVVFKGAVTVGKMDMNASGQAKITVSELETDHVECDIDGSGTITVNKGNAKTGKYSILNKGFIHAFGLAVPDLTCKVTGTGSAEVHPTDNLKVNVIGKGQVRYKGPTAVQQKIIGKGTVEEVQ